MEERLTITATTYKEMPYKLPSFVYSVLDQHDSCNLLIAHDGPSSDGSREFMEGICSKHHRIRYFETKERKADWGHSSRAEMLNMVNTEWIQFQNCDNQIVYNSIRFFKEYLTNPNIDLIIFPIIHSYFNYTTFLRGFSLGNIDMCQFIIRTKIAKEVGFNHRCITADGLFVQEVLDKFPAILSRSITLENIIAVHN